MLDEFISYLQVEKSVSNHTMRAYSSDLRQFFDFLQLFNVWDKKSSPDQIKNIGRSTIKSFIAFLFNKRYSPGALERKISTLRSFFRHLTLTGAITVNPALGVDLPSKPKPVPDFLTIDETISLLSAPDLRSENPANIRDIAILELLYATGVRVSELSTLSVGDIDFDRKVIKIKGKGKKERMVPFGAKAQTAIQNMLDKNRGSGISDQHDAPLFLNYKKRRLSVRSIHSIVKKYAQLGGMGRPVAPHRLRHTFATHMLEGGADLRSIQEMLGHSSLSTTQKYTHVNLQRLMKVYDTAHPRASLEERD